MSRLVSNKPYEERCLILFCGRFNADTAYYEKYKVEIVAKLERNEMHWYAYDNRKQVFVEFKVLLRTWSSDEPAAWWNVDELKAQAALEKHGYILESFHP